MPTPGAHARLAATAHARAVLASSGHGVTPRLRRIFAESPKLDETWVGHCERCGESFTMTLKKGSWEAGGMVYVWPETCRGYERSYYHDEEEADFDDE